MPMTLRRCARPPVDFWSMVATKTMPPVDGSDDCSRALSERFKGDKGLTIDLPTAAQDCIDRLRELKETIGQLEEQKKLSENELKAMLGDAGSLALLAKIRLAENRRTDE